MKSKSSIMVVTQFYNPDGTTLSFRSKHYFRVDDLIREVRAKWKQAMKLANKE